MAQEERFPLTVTPLKAQAGCDAINHDEADYVAAVVLDETFELLNLLPDRVPDVLLAFGIHIHVRSPDARPEQF